jgi:molecular chaperone DnaK
MYQAAQAAEGAPEGGDEPKKDDVIDADFQEVDEGDKKKRA